MAERDGWPDDPNVQAPTNRKSSSGCGKVLLIVGGLGLTVMLLCCGIGGWFAWTLQPKFINNPVEVTDMGKQILDVKIPEGFQPDTAVNMDNFVMTMRMANFKHTEGKGMLLLGDIRMKIGDPNQKVDFQQNRQMNGKKTLNMRTIKTETREFDVRGKKVPFRFSEAVDQDSNKEFRVVEGNLDIPGGGVFIELAIEADAYDEDAVIEMIESIR